MKMFTLILASFLFLASCTSVEKLVERGDYNEAVLLSIRKLQGKKKKKTKYVKGLEEAFAKINQRDLAAAKRLLDQNRASNWIQLHNIYSNIEERQNAIQPLLPLISKDRYKANFTFINVAGLLNEASDKAAAYEYQRGINLLERGKKGNKEAARSAYSAFLATRNYVSLYKDADDKANEAKYHGITRVAIDVVNKANVIIPAGFEREILDLQIHDLNGRWTEYYTHNTNHPIDVQAVLEIRDMDISPEREVVNRHIDTKEIKDGFEYVLDAQGNVMKDTSGNDIKVDRFKTIEARITEVIRTKAAFISGNVVYFDVHSGERFRSERVNVEANFEDISCRVKGDVRALSDKRRKHVKKHPAPFPSDFALTMDAAINLKTVLKREIKRAIL